MMFVILSMSFMGITKNVIADYDYSEYLGKDYIKT
jgi:hypothetical protein